MFEYGKVLSGGAVMNKGLTKGINNKLKSRKDEIKHRDMIADAVINAYKVKTVSSQHTNNIHKGDKFSKPSVPSKV
jgi:hypothetical protein